MQDLKKEMKTKIKNNSVSYKKNTNYNKALHLVYLKSWGHVLDLNYFVSCLVAYLLSNNEFQDDLQE